MAEPLPFGRALPPGVFGPAAPSMRQAADFAAMAARNAAPAAQAIPAEQAAVNSVRAAMAAGGGSGAAPAAAQAARTGWVSRLGAAARNPWMRAGGAAAVAVPIALEALYPDDAERALRAQDAAGVRDAWGRSAAEGAGAFVSTAARIGGRVGYNALVAPPLAAGGAFIRGLFGIPQDAPERPASTERVQAAPAPRPPSDFDRMRDITPPTPFDNTAPVFRGLTAQQMMTALRGLPAQEVMPTMRQVMAQPPPARESGADRRYRLATELATQRIGVDRQLLEQGRITPDEYRLREGATLRELLGLGQPTIEQMMQGRGE